MSTASRQFAARGRSTSIRSILTRLLHCRRPAVLLLPASALLLPGPPAGSGHGQATPSCLPRLCPAVDAASVTQESAAQEQLNHATACSIPAIFLGEGKGNPSILQCCVLLRNFHPVQVSLHNKVDLGSYQQFCQQRFAPRASTRLS